MVDLNYRVVWDRRSENELAAFDAVDNSGSEQVVRATGAWTANQLRAALKPGASDTVLELGCGAARIGHELARDCGQWIGVDISPNMIKVSGQRLAGFDNIRLEVLERTALDMIETNSVDKAYSVAVLCHMDKEDLFLYLREIARVLKPGALAYVETWNLADPVGWQRWMYEVEFWNRSDHGDRKDVARNQFCTPDEFRLYAERAGLDVLICFSDSPWVQLVVGRGLDPDRMAAERERLSDIRHEIAYSPLFGQLFREACRVIYGELHPSQALKRLKPLLEHPEARLYELYIQGLWEQDPARYGDPAPGA